MCYIYMYASTPSSAERLSSTVGRHAGRRAQSHDARRSDLSGNKLFFETAGEASEVGWLIIC